MTTLLSQNNRSIIEQNALNLLNQTELMNSNTANSPRAVGDAVQSFLESNLHNCFPPHLVQNFNNTFARRSMADCAFEDTEGNYYVIDFKTHSMDTKFNMPNLTSVELLSRFYSDLHNYFVIMIISYTINDNILAFKNCKIIPIEIFDWSCLTLGALGWGQIQIANSNNIVINENSTRKKWMLQLCDALDLFYPNEISKITQRINHFNHIRSFWESQVDA